MVHSTLSISILLMEIAKNSGIEPKPEGVAVSDGLES